MATLLAGRTTFVIAHRLSTVRRADLILLMEDGQIIERGTHDQLIRSRGVYHDMVARQMESHNGRAEDTALDIKLWQDPRGNLSDTMGQGTRL